MKKIYEYLIAGGTIIIVGIASFLFFQRSFPIIYNGLNNLTHAFGIDINETVELISRNKN